MSYKRRVTYRGIESVAMRSFSKLGHGAISERCVKSRKNGQSSSTVGSTIDRYGYIGFTSQDS